MTRFKSGTHDAFVLNIRIYYFTERVERGVTNICQDYPSMPKEYPHVNVTPFGNSYNSGVSLYCKLLILNLFPFIHPFLLGTNIKTTGSAMSASIRGLQALPQRDFNSMLKVPFK